MDSQPVEQKVLPPVEVEPEPSPRPADPSWVWGSFWTKTDEDGVYYRIFHFPEHADKAYVVDASDGRCRVSMSRASLDEALADAIQAGRLVRLYKLDRFLCHPAELGDVARPLPPDPIGFHPLFSDRLEAAIRILDSQGLVAMGQYVARLAYSQGSSRFEPSQLAALVAAVSSAAGRRNHGSAQESWKPSQGADGPLSS